MKQLTDQTLAGLIDELAHAYPNRSAISYLDTTLTFSQFRGRAIAFAKGLHSLGVRQGDKVGILLGNCTEWLQANFAAQYLGATMVALNTWYTPREIAYVLSHSDVSVLVVAERFLKSDYVAILSELRETGEIPGIRTVVCAGPRRAPTPGWTDFDAVITAGESISESVLERPRATVASDDIAYILYTSGSTARPKGVALRHRSLLANGFNIGERLRLIEEDIVFLPISLFWGLGCENALMAAWGHGAHIVLQPHFEAESALRLIEQCRCTAVYCTANITQLLFQHPALDQFDLSSLKKGTFGGTAELIKRVKDRYISGACRGYGLTETYGYSTVTDAEDPLDKHTDTFGRPLPGNTIHIVSPDTGEKLGSGELGEIRQKGHVLAYYYKNPEQTKEAFDENGFFKTGDLGFLDNDGYVHFKGRLKEMLRSAGMNVSPAEVEEVLRMHPDIEEAFVTGIPDPEREQVVGALILLRKQATMTAEQVMVHCRGQLAAYKVPRQVRFVAYSELPFTTTGKIHRQRLQELFLMMK
jgi:fatty-acyl-CoA synthase